MGRLMAHVNVVINGRQYRMACEDGQEDHLLQLATDFDRRIGKMREDFGQIGDMRLTVMAALMLADEFSDVSKRVARLDSALRAESAKAATQPSTACTKRVERNRFREKFMLGDSAVAE